MVQKIKLNEVRMLIRSLVNEEINKENLLGNIYSDLHYGGHYILTNIQKIGNDIIVTLTNLNDGNTIEINYELFMSISGKNNFTDEFRYLLTGKDLSKIDKFNQDFYKNKDNVEKLKYQSNRKEGEDLYHRTGSYYRR